MNNFNDFLQYVHGNNTGVIKSYSNKNMKIINASEVNKENKAGDIYFVVNSGGDKDKMIENFNAVFVDLDCGRDTNKNYHPLNVVSEYKNKKLKEINEFSIKPTIIVETRNGLHVYWILNSNTNIEIWKDCILKLIKRFDGDKQVNNPARLMRLPFTKWMKDANNPFDIGIVEFNDVRYCIDDILIGLSDIKVEEDRCVRNSMKYNKHLTTPYTPMSSSNVELIRNGDINTLRSKLNIITPLELENQNEFYIHITQMIDLSEFLGVGTSNCKCVFHNDGKPSAGIFITERNQPFYKCHSSNCGFMGNIIRCVERLRNCNRPQAISFIKDLYMLTIKDTEWQRQQKDILEENKRMIREGELELYYPEVYALIKNYSNLIYLLHDIAADHVYEEKFTDSQDNVVFFSSLSHVAKLLNYPHEKRLADRESLLAFLKLLNKLPESEIPREYLDKAIKQKIKNNQNYKVNFFSIPSYCDGVLEQSQIRAESYKENNVTMRGWGRELLQRTFGSDITNEVYPQHKNSKTSGKSQIKTHEIHKVLNEILSEKGFVTEKDIVESLRGKFGKENTIDQVKRSIQEILDSYELKKIKLNKELKNIYGCIDLKGYPFIIVRK